MPVAIQSRGFDEPEWSNHQWRRSHFEAYLTAMNQAKLTGRIYRLLNDEGQVIEEVRRGDSR